MTGTNIQINTLINAMVQAEPSLFNNKEGNLMHPTTTLKEKQQIRTIQKTMQHEMAKNLLQELKTLGATIGEELDALTLLDALGVAGLSLTISEDASLTYIQLCENQQ